jgi:putative heme transporter
MLVHTSTGHSGVSTIGSGYEPRMNFASTRNDGGPKATFSARLDVASGYGWRLVVVAAAIGLIVWLVGQLLIVVVPVAVATLIARALWPVSRRLRRRGLPPALAAALTLVGFLIVIGSVFALSGAAIAGESDELSTTVSQGVDDVTDWLVDDSSFDVSRADVDRWRSQAGDALQSFGRSGGAALASGAIAAVEVAAGTLLALIIAFFLLKDGERWFERVVGARPAEQRDLTDRTIRRGWDAIGGYLRGAAALGGIEAAAIGATMAGVGASLVPSVMMITFMAAFVPIVGATLAGVVATLVTLVTAGAVPALIVAGVTLVVQQVDNDVLAPVVYSRALQMHPLVVLLGIAAGGSLFGFIGTIFAVPFLAVTLNMIDEIRISSATVDQRVPEPAMQ